MAEPNKPGMQPSPQLTPAQAAAKSEAAKKTAEERKAEAEAQLDKEDEAREEANVKASAAAAKVKPTPSQRESDLAKMGVFHPDDREPSGAPPDPHALRSQADKDKDAQADKADYKTRDTKK